MCGIAGIVAPDHLHLDEGGRAVRMRDILAHRGPDGAGLHTDAHAALAHRRLSIVDLAGGHQPLANEDGTVWVTFNGEIYNHATVRRDLESAGHRYRTRSDTETIVHAYEEWGDDCVHRFRGMFAFAVWDAPQRRLLLVRDRLGVKPVYWAIVPASAANGRGERLLFASEIKAILESGLIEARPNSGVMSEVLATRATAGAETLFAGIYKLLPGHRLVYQDGRPRITRYWDVPHAGPHPELARAPEAELVDRFRSMLHESVRLRLMSDVPLGMFLSGGIDSAAIAAVMTREMHRPVETFSVAFEDRAYSELEYARQSARSIGANPHEIVISDQDYFGALPRLVWHEDEPIAHPSSVPLHFVSALARQHVKVVLTGEGSDELLAGYGRYPRALLNWHAGGIYERVMPPALRAAVASALIPRLPGAVRRYASRSFLAMPRDAVSMFLDNFAGVGLRAQRELLNPAAIASDPYASTLAYFNDTPDGGGMLGRFLYTDIKTYLVELLMKQDQMSMSASIESRVPFLDHPLVEFAAQLPDRMKLSGFTTKRILRKAVRGIVPDEILTRRKMGFPVPFARWTAERWNGVAREVLLDRRARERGLFRPPAVERLLDEHRTGTRRGGDAIWALLNVEIWYRTFIDGDGVQTLPSPARSTPAAVDSSFASAGATRSAA
jgi:asparagine synthase (glutamine-hydrolysing)